MTTTPVLAQASQNQASSAEVSRETEKKAKKSKLDGETSATPLILSVIAAALVVGGIVIATDQDDDTPTSP
jgi:hypothetical protein